MHHAPGTPLGIPWPRLRPRIALAALAALSIVVCGAAAASPGEHGHSAEQLRRFIDGQVGGLQQLQVPASDAAIPTPLLPDGRPDPLYRTTEAKRYLGKQLFFDPIRTARIQPAFGGQLSTRQTASCGSCHLGEAASRAGTLLNFAVGGEGRGYTDENGNFIPRRRPRADLPKLRSTPLFPGDALVDELPTLTDVYELAVGSPARGRKLPSPGALLRTGRLDALDSVARNAPSVLGFAFNNRLLQGGFAGEPDASPGGLNPFGTTAGENVALLLLDAHRMLDAQSAELQKIPVFVKLFRDAFPEEAAMADAKGDPNQLINDITVLRATASFMRTVVTRNTPWDRFLAGDNHALTPAQRRGARLFFTPAMGGAGGAGCYGCHSGPMLNKQHGDPDVAGVGTWVEQNFHNLGLADHPLQALNRLAHRDPNFRDDGRREITAQDSDAFKFRVLTLRQVKDSRFFTHNGSFTSVKDVVKYFNAGIPQDPVAGNAPTISRRFTNPRGPGWPRGLGLSDGQVDDLADFIENGLYDPAFVKHDPRSGTRTFQPNEQDLTYSRFRPDLAALGAVDGRMASGLPVANDDPLSRRDMGLEFLDVTSQAQVARGGDGTLRITNNSTEPIDTHLLVIVQGLDRRTRLANASGHTRTGEPYLRVHLPEGLLNPGQSVLRRLVFAGGPGGHTPHYSLRLLSGQGQP